MMKLRGPDNLKNGAEVLLNVGYRWTDCSKRYIVVGAIIYLLLYIDQKVGVVVSHELRVESSMLSTFSLL